VGTLVVCARQTRWFPFGYCAWWNLPTGRTVACRCGQRGQTKPARPCGFCRRRQSLAARQPPRPGKRLLLSRRRLRTIERRRKPHRWRQPGFRPPRNRLLSQSHRRSGRWTRSPSGKRNLLLQQKPLRPSLLRLRAQPTAPRFPGGSRDGWLKSDRRIGRGGCTSARAASGAVVTSGESSTAGNEAPSAGGDLPPARPVQGSGGRRRTKRRR